MSLLFCRAQYHQSLAVMVMFVWWVGVPTMRVFLRSVSMESMGLFVPLDGISLTLLLCAGSLNFPQVCVNGLIYNHDTCGVLITMNANNSKKNSLSNWCSIIH